VPPGLQNLCWARCVLGEFDSHTLTPTILGIAVYIEGSDFRSSFCVFCLDEFYLYYTKLIKIINILQ